MKEYTAEDGLNLLTYLGITRITDEEKRVFRDLWAKVYEQSKDLISATWKLYAEALPFTCGDGDNGSLLVAHLRDGDFGDRLEVTGFAEDLKERSLEAVLKDGPHKFYMKVQVEE